MVRHLASFLLSTTLLRVEDTTHARAPKIETVVDVLFGGECTFGGKRNKGAKFGACLVQSEGIVIWRVRRT